MDNVLITMSGPDGKREAEREDSDLCYNISQAI